MGDPVNQDMNLLAPYEQSWTFGDDEKALKSLFLDVFNELFAEQIKDIHHYGMPHLGSPSVVERFTKQDGLAVLRRANSSDAIMRVIYANWKSIGSKRGLAFVEFVLRMIWGDQWQIQRLYHSIDRAKDYPRLITTGPTRNSFLTSRIFITLGQNINVDEALEIAPVVAKLVPANIVARVATGLDLGEINPLDLAVVAMPYMVANFQKFESISSLIIPWTPWGVLKNYTLSNDTARYTGYKTNYQEMYHGPATHNLRAAAAKAMLIAEYSVLSAVHDAILAIHPTAVASEAEIPLKVVTASFLPEFRDMVAAGQVMLNRVRLSNGGNYTGNEFMPSVLRNLEWFLKGGVLHYNVASPQNERAPYLYKIADTLSLTSYSDAAKKHIADLVARDPLWAKYTLQELIESEDSLDTFMQKYVAMEVPDGPHLRAPNAPFDDWKAQPQVMVIGRQVAYSGIKTNGTDYYDSLIDMDLSDAAYRSLSDPDMQQLQGFKNTVNQMTGTTDWTIDTGNKQVSYLQSVEIGEVDNQDWAHTEGGEYYATKELAKRAYEIANGVTCTLDLDGMTCIDALDAVIFEGPLLGRPKVLALDPEQDADDIGELDGQDWAHTEGGEYYATKELAKRAYEIANGVTCTLDLESMTCLDDLGGVSYEGVLLGRAKVLALEPPLQKFISFADVLEQLFTQAAADDHAQDYLDAVAMTAFHADTEKQLIKVDDFIGRFEENKILRDSDLPPVPVAVNRIYEFIVIREENPNFRGEDAVTGIPVEADKLTNIFVNARVKAIANNNAELLDQIDNAVISAYKRDKVWTTTNNLYAQYFIEVPFADVVNQIFTNFQEGNATYKASARAFLSKVAESIFLPGANDQLVKVSELSTQFEAGKVYRSLV